MHDANVCESPPERIFALYDVPMHATLSPGAIHVSVASLEDFIAKAKVGGFTGLELNPSLLEGRSATEVAETLAGEELVAAGFGMPVQFREDEARWKEDLEKLPAIAKTMSEFGMSRTFTWIMPGSNDKNFDQNYEFHVTRLKPVAAILADHGIRFGLEFVGPKTSRDSFRHPFVYTTHAMLRMAKEVGANCGLLLDSWHWYTSEGTEADILALNEQDVVYVHTNDAPAGIAVDDQLDHKRELPKATGVIDLDTFFGSLRKIGYQGPVVVEPFLASLKELPSDEDRLRKVGESLKQTLGA